MTKEVKQAHAREIFEAGFAAGKEIGALKGSLWVINSLIEDFSLFTFDGDLKTTPTANVILGLEGSLDNHSGEADCSRAWKDYKNKNFLARYLEVEGVALLGGDDGNN